MDGVNELNNIVVIGTTNRRDMMDVALLRPGRFDASIGMFHIFTDPLSP